MAQVGYSASLHSGAPVSCGSPAPAPLCPSVCSGTYAGWRSVHSRCHGRCFGCNSARAVHTRKSGHSCSMPLVPGVPVSSIWELPVEYRKGWVWSSRAILCTSAVWRTRRSRGTGTIHTCDWCRLQTRWYPRCPAAVSGGFWSSCPNWCSSAIWRHLGCAWCRLAARQYPSSLATASGRCRSFRAVRYVSAVLCTCLAAPAPVVEYISPTPTVHAIPAPAFAASAPVVKYISAAPAVSCVAAPVVAAPALVMVCPTPAPAVDFCGPMHRHRAGPCHLGRAGAPCPQIQGQRRRPPFELNASSTVHPETAHAPSSRTSKPLPPGWRTSPEGSVSLTCFTCLPPPVFSSSSFLTLTVSLHDEC